MEERRESSRVALDFPISLQIDDQKVEGTLCNLSTQGALVALSAEHSERADAEILGLDASFTIKPTGEPTRKYTGELIRFYFQGDTAYLVLRFWKPYEELSLRR